MKKMFYLLPLVMLACSEDTNTENENSELITTNDAELSDESEIAETLAPMDMGLRRLQSDDLPACDYDGYLEDCWTWEDKNGDNYLFRSIEEPEMVYPEEDGWEKYDQTLHVYHYIENEGGVMSLMRDLTDFEKGCEFDLSAEHLEEVKLEDLDKDNIGEITFGYRLACRSDASGSSQKVVTFENGDKYILRGWAMAMGYGGEFEAGNEYDSAPVGFLKNATEYWERNKVEFELTE